MTWRMNFPPLRHLRLDLAEPKGGTAEPTVRRLCNPGQYPKFSNYFAKAGGEIR